MKKGLLFLAAMLVMCTFTAFAQDDKPARPDLAIGSPMPAFTIESSVHRSSSAAAPKTILTAGSVK